MKYDKRSEYGAPPEEYRLPQEQQLPAPEHGLPEEQYSRAKEYPAPETVTKAASESGSKLRDRLKKMVFMPAAAAVATFSVVFAAFNYDVLGGVTDDIYGRDPWEWEEYSNEIVDVEYSDPDDGVTQYYYHVIYNETGDSYSPEPPDEEGRTEMERWIEEQGGDLSTLHLYDTDLTYLGWYKSEDAIIVGDEDNMDDAYIPQGEVYKLYRRDLYYEVFGPHGGESSLPDEEEPFPSLPNLAPDFAGKYAWSGLGSEEFVRFDDSQYLHAGSYWVDQESAEVVAVPGAVYDKETNTLTLNNFSGGILETNLMGNGFTIELIGENSLDFLLVWGASYGGSVTFKGSGSLTVNASQSREYGIQLFAEASESCIMVGSGVALEVYGTNAAVEVFDSTHPQGIYTGNGMVIKGGTSGTVTDGDITYYTVVDGDGNPSMHVVFERAD